MTFLWDTFLLRLLFLMGSVRNKFDKKDIFIMRHAGFLHLYAYRRMHACVKRYPLKSLWSIQKVNWSTFWPLPCFSSKSGQGGGGSKFRNPSDVCTQIKIKKTKFELHPSWIEWVLKNWISKERNFIHICLMKCMTKKSFLLYAFISWQMFSWKQQLTHNVWTETTFAS